jgi:hypothetical protein
MSSLASVTVWGDLLKCSVLTVPQHYRLNFIRLKLKLDDTQQTRLSDVAKVVEFVNSRDLFLLYVY